LPAIVYVSCDPPTLGRDLAALADAGYRLEALETFEMFPHTSHVETIAALRPPPRGERSDPGGAK
jgi:23S rRNA (uracil1939-C5)-methyltransferase